MTKVAQIGVIGAGWWAAANHIPVLQANPCAHIAAVNRLGTAELEKVRAHFNIPYGAEDYRKMLDDVRLDGVVISSPHPLHFEHARRALERGLHVLIEKPLTTSAKDARELVDLAQHQGRSIVVPYGWNFKTYTKAAREQVMSGALGRIEHVQCHMASSLHDLFAGEGLAGTSDHMFQPLASTWADPGAAGGYGWGQLSHALGLFLYVTDLAPARVFAMTGHSPTGVDYYDAAALQFINGATGAISGAGTAPKQCGFQIDLRIFGSEGMLLLDIERERLEVHRRDGIDFAFPMKPGDGAYSCEEPLNCFVDICLGKDVHNPAPGIVGQRAVEILDALYRSARSARLEEV